MILLQVDGEDVLLAGHEVVCDDVRGCFLGFQGDIHDVLFEVVDYVELGGPAFEEYLLLYSAIVSK